MLNSFTSFHILISFYYYLLTSSFSKSYIICWAYSRSISKCTTSVKIINFLKYEPTASKRGKKLAAKWTLFKRGPYEEVNLFLANVLILFTLKPPKNQRFSKVFRRYKMGTLPKNGLMFRTVINPVRTRENTERKNTCV